MTLTTAQAAALVEMSPATLRTVAYRARRAGVELHAPRELWPDARTPLWDEARLADWLAARPGRGNRTARDQSNDS